MLDYLAAIQADSAVVAELAGTTSSDAAVPSCPDWTFADLIAHLGRVQRFWAANVRAGNPDAPWDGPRPTPGRDLSRWMRESTAELVEALEATPADAPCWTWWGEPRTAGAVARHQVQEAAVHRWDAELAAGVPSPLADEVAHDGVAEFLAVMPPPDLPGQVVLRSRDTGGSWTVGPSEDAGAGAGPTGTAQSGAVRSAVAFGTASDLVLLLYGRLPLSGFDVEGDDKLVLELLDSADNS